MTLELRQYSMINNEDLYEQVCSISNLILAWRKAKKHKTKKDYVKEFEKDTLGNLLKLQKELIEQTYSPNPLITFILRDPKTRKISKSAFRDRIIHHAIVNIIEPIFDTRFIYDSYANRADVIRDAVRRFIFESQIGTINSKTNSVKEVRKIRENLSKQVKSYKDIEEIDNL